MDYLVQNFHNGDVCHQFGSVRPLARPREFDAEVALDHALETFWSKGYEATSVDDLCDSMGISRSSMYHTFGSKQELLLQTLDKYDRRACAGIARLLDDVRPIRAGIEVLLHGVVKEAGSGRGRRGCFVGNCAAELAANERTAAKRLKLSLTRMEVVFQAALVRAQIDGEIALGADPRALARFLTASVQGLRLIAKTKPGRGVLDDVVSTTLGCLE